MTANKPLFYDEDHGGPAFPFKFVQTSGATEVYAGMTLRDWLASQAPEEPIWWMLDETTDLAKMLEADNDMEDSAKDRWRNDFNMRRITSWRYHYADAMLEARK